jgi:hypothetical protein
LLITLMLPSNFSFASARWVNAESTPDCNTYVDSQTVSYNKDDNNITYWIKRTSPPAYGYTMRRLLLMFGRPRRSRTPWAQLGYRRSLLLSLLP